MHYLEDYLELLEPLRDIMREKLTLMRENDLKLQVEYSQLDEDFLKFLHNYRSYQNQSSLSPTKTRINIHSQNPIAKVDQFVQLTAEQLTTREEKQTEYNQLVERHGQLVELTNKKVILANESHEFVERYFKKLENDLYKFKMELEADYSGLTETLEKRFANEGCNKDQHRFDENHILDSSLLDIEPLFDPFNDPTMSNILTDDYAHQSSHSLALLHRKQNLHSRVRKRLQTPSSTKIHGKQKRHIHSDRDEFSLNSSLHLNHSLFGDLNLSTSTDTIDEERYCFCNEMSYGDMIACDNSTCQREWFHYACVGIVTPPKGKWYCTECSQLLKLLVTN